MNIAGDRQQEAPQPVKSELRTRHPCQKSDRTQYSIQRPPTCRCGLDPFSEAGGTDHLIIVFRDAFPAEMVTARRTASGRLALGMIQARLKLQLHAVVSPFGGGTVPDSGIPASADSWETWVCA